MKQSITINVPEGKKAIYNESTKTVEFVDIGPIRSKSWEEFCKNHTDCKGEYFINSASGITKLYNHYDRTKLICNNTLATKEDAEGIIALIQLTRLHDEWVGDWKISSKSINNAIIYSPFNDDFRIQEVNNQWNSILTFPSYSDSYEFLNCFKDLIEKAKKFI